MGVLGIVFDIMPRCRDPGTPSLSPTGTHLNARRCEARAKWVDLLPSGFHYRICSPSDPLHVCSSSI